MGFTSSVPHPLKHTSQNLSNTVKKNNEIKLQKSMEDRLFYGLLFIIIILQACPQRWILKKRIETVEFRIEPGELTT